MVYVFSGILLCLQSFFGHCHALGENSTYLDGPVTLGSLSCSKPLVCSLSEGFIGKTSGGCKAHLWLGTLRILICHASSHVAIISIKSSAGFSLYSSGSILLFLLLLCQEWSSQSFFLLGKAYFFPKFSSFKFSSIVTFSNNFLNLWLYSLSSLFSLLGVRTTGPCDFLHPNWKWKSFSYSFW